MESRKEVFNRAMADFLEIPRDLVMDIPKVTIIGKNELLLQNYRGIIEYRSDLLRVNLSRGFVEILGNNLEIKALTPDDISLTGEINSVLFRD